MLNTIRIIDLTDEKSSTKLGDEDFQMEIPKI
jgi:hypothetical protein